jgi:hypothetical protein
MNLGTGQLSAVTGTSVRLVSHDDLMHQRFVVITSEQGIGCRDGGRLLPLIVDQFQFHG